ncbi:unnamed protein product [Penicillium manginii]
MDPKSPYYIPFSNLDVWCTWKETNKADVEIIISVDVWCTPNTEFLVLDTRTPTKSFVKDFSLVRKPESESQPDAAIRDDVALNEPPPLDVPASSPAVDVRISTPHTQSITESETLGSIAGLFDSSLPDAESASVVSNSESIVVQENLHQDGFLGDDILVDPFCDGLELDSSPFLNMPKDEGRELNQDQADSDQLSSTFESPDQKSGGPLFGTFLSRKRSAKAASLPDSVTDSERGYSRGKKLEGAHGPPSIPSTPSPAKHSQTTSSNNSESHQRSLIPRPRSRLSHGQSRSESSKDSMPPSLPPSLQRGKSTPIIEADFRRFENDISPLFKGSKPKKKGTEKDIGLDRRVLKHKDGSPIVCLSTRSPVTPSKSNHKAHDAEARTQSDLEKLSTVANIGSPCDFTGLPGDSDIADNASFSVSPGQSGAAVLVQPLPIWITDNNSTDESEREPEPRLTFTAGKFYIVTPSGMEPAAYMVKITLSVPLQDGRPGWRELLVPGLPRLPPDEYGYVYFIIPQELSLEFRTSHLKRYKIIEGCLMGQMLISSRLVLPLRPCLANFFGYLKDFNVSQEIVQDILSDNESIRLVRYHAICSINLIQTDFWAEKCGIWLYIHGGPQGEFFCSLQKPGFQDIHLQHHGNDNAIGVSRVEIMAGRSNLDKFAITWVVKIAKGSPIRMPRIKSSEHAEADIEVELLEQATDTQDPECARVEAIYKGSSMEFLIPPETKVEIPSITLTNKPRHRWWRYLEYCLRIYYVLFLLFFCWTRYQMGVPFPFLGTPISEISCAQGDPNHPNVLHVCSGIEPESKSLADAIAEAGAKPGAYELHCEVGENPPGVHHCSFALFADEAGVDEAQVLVDMSKECVSETASENESDIRLVARPLRDKIDYFLGWRGPVA